jgi:hypothetical protein
MNEFSNTKTLKSLKLHNVGVCGEIFLDITSAKVTNKNITVRSNRNGQKLKNVTEVNLTAVDCNDYFKITCLHV